VGACTDGWEYDTENFHRSAVSDLNWVCDDSWIPAFSQSIFFIGAVPGMLFFGWLSDHYGRIPAILSSNLVALVSGIAIPFVTEYVAFCVLRFMMGLAFNSFFTIPLGEQSASLQKINFLVYFMSQVFSWQPLNMWKKASGPSLETLGLPSPSPCPASTNPGWSKLSGTGRSSTGCFSHRWLSSLPLLS